MIVVICEVLLNRRFKYRNINILVVIELAIAIQVITELDVSKRRTMGTFRLAHWKSVSISSIKDFRQTLTR